ncbi:MAG: hypothetical protein FWE32_09030 [Oscillospiraceae bacterium]|nr:hypothetical protein [Oscillospiraceae bacterium]
MEKKFLAKSLLIWLSITPLAVLNGGLREYILAPRLGAAAQPVSGLLLLLCVFAVAYLFIPRLGKAGRPAYRKMGILWVAATIVFEFLLGSALGMPLGEMLMAYNIFTGNLWLAVVVFIGFAPSIVAKMRGIVN